MSDNPPNPLESLLGEFALGPAWARAKPDKPENKSRAKHEGDSQPQHRDDRRSRNPRDDNRDNRRQGGNPRRNFDKSSNPRQDFRKEEIAPAEGVSVTLTPDQNAIQLVCKEIHQVARVYPLFDVAQIILAERVRIRASFEISEKKPPFYLCKFEEAIFLTKEEALQYFLKADWRTRFIEESTVEVEPPKGNFQSVAKCGFSGEWLGPPNYHNYQTEIRRIHRERFSHIPFEAYTAKIRTERSEEAVAEWLDSMKIQTRWRILTEPVAADFIRPAENTNTKESPEASVEPPAPTEESDGSCEEGKDGLSEPSISETPPSEDTPSSEKTPDPEPQPEAPKPSEDIKWFTDRAEFERAISAELIDKAFKTTRKAKVSAAIPAKNLSPGLLVRLKGAGSHFRKHPAIIIPAICKSLEAEHMAVFKRKGKLFTGPARPHALAPDAVLAPRPGQMVKWIRENTPAKLEGLWKAVLPEGATAPPAEYAADLFWLLQQGHILLYTDDTLVVQEPPKPPEPKKPKAPKKKAKSATDKPQTATTPENPEIPEPVAEATEATAPEAAPEPPISEPAAESTEPEAAPEPETSESPDDKPTLPEV